MVNVSRLGHTYDGMNQQGTLYLFGSSLRQLFMGPVDGISGLKRNDIGVTKCLEAWNEPQPVSYEAQKNRNASAD